MSNLILCAIAGGSAGWVGYSFLKWNAAWGLSISMVVGAVGGFLGGALVAPMLAAGAGAVNPGDFNPFALFVALASAAAILIISGMIQKRLNF